MRLFLSRCFSALAFSVFTHELVQADLPIHVVTRDIGGSDWTFLLGALKDKPTTCASGVPNSNTDNLREDPEEWFRKHEVVSDELHLFLSDTLKPIKGTFLHAKDPSKHATASHRLAQFPDTRSFWSVLPVYFEGTVVGHWTTVYDEGFEVIFQLPRNGTTVQLLAFTKYAKVDDSKCSGKPVADGDSENKDGETPCYETDSSKTMVGWYTVEDDATGGKKWGCYIAHKKSRESDSTSGLPRMREVRSTVREMKPRDARYLKHGMHIYRKTSRLVSRNNDDALAASFLDMKSEMSTGLYACTNPEQHSSFLKTLPSAFSWGDPFTDPNFGGDDETITNQGSCGSCYSVAATYILQKRAQILLERLVGKRDEWKKLFAGPKQLSAQAPMSCSYYNQGCDGGYPYLVGKTVTEFGTPSVGCMEYVAANAKCAMPDVQALSNNTAAVHHKSSTENIWRSSPTEFFRKRKVTTPGGGAKVLSPISDFLKESVALSAADRADECADDKRVYATGYGYVGGCYECCSRAAMMMEIYHHGPVAVAFDAPPELFRYNGGVFDKSPPSHSRVCDDPKKGLNGWEYTTHAVVVVGWGQDPPATRGGQPVDYWVVRNSWGPHWGNGGYMKLVRGKNIGAIEAQAVYIDPDPRRGILRKVLEEQGVSTGRALSTYFASLVD